MSENTERNDGGQAFPYIQWKTPDGLFVSTNSSGMTLRDYFAGQAITAIAKIVVDAMKIGGVSAGEFESSVAEGAYQVADAMLAAREKACDLADQALKNGEER